MKSERRHQLQTNDLANMLGRWIKEASPHATWVLIAVASFLTVWVGWSFYQRYQNTANGEGWRSFFLATASQDREQIQNNLESVANDYEDSAPGIWAILVAADVDLSDGIQQLFEDRALAEISLQAAVDKYKQVLKSLGDSKKTPLIRQRGLFGLAQAKEALSEVEDAAKYYQQMVDLAPDSVLGKQATIRLAMVDDLERWYYWFKRQEPRPLGSARPSRQLQGTLPGLDNPSDFPNLDLTPAPLQVTPGTEVPSTDKEPATPDTTSTEKSEPNAGTKEKPPAEKTPSNETTKKPPAEKKSEPVKEPAK